MNVFLDVGGHVGQSLEEVLKPIYRFDVIHCFEPQLSCYEMLEKNFMPAHGGRLVLHNYGLADFDGEKNLYGDRGEAGVSMFSDKRDVDENFIQKCQFSSASRFFDENITKKDMVIMKLNCEGGELLILRDLIRSGNINLLTNVMIDFDIRKIPSKKHEQENIINELKNAGFKNHILHNRVMVGKTHQDRLRFWLSSLDNAPEFTDLTNKEKLMRILPFGIRRFIHKRLKIKTTG